MVRHFGRMNAADHDRIKAAIAAAEGRTSARFVMTVLPQSDRYTLYPVIWAALAALVTGGILGWFLPQFPLRDGFAVQVAAFLLLSIVFEWRPVRPLLVPAVAKRHHASQFAHREFAARILAHPERSGGVLLFISEAERYVELLADAKTHAAVGEVEWNRIVGQFVSRMRAGAPVEAVLDAVGACAELLERHHPN
ncbi:MAG: hypothetical protein KGO02_22190 [Alphaproteobacteria bacterium]|nr:hypothetical protein [Alphaproteobacteria bacterium]